MSYPVPVLDTGSQRHRPSSYMYLLILLVPLRPRVEHGDKIAQI